MNPLDNLVPPEHFYLDEDEDLERASILAFYRRIARQERERERRRRQAVATMDQEISSDSEMETLTKQVKDGKMDLTPAGSTPQELVKLDP